jgi:hypothetical protein
MRNRVVIRTFLFLIVVLAFSYASFGQVVISVNFGPPALPVYEQPVCPEDGYIWTPGFWAYDDDDGYYWVPGTWVEAPRPGYLWTPGYWGWGDGVYIFHEGYWGEHVGFYGGINYGYGYGGRGYEGGRWDNGRFFYNTSVNRVNVTIIRNTYNTRIVENNTTRVSYNGGSGGVEARPTTQEETYNRENHVGRVAAQNEHIQQARSNPQLRASNNQGKPPIAATARPADFKSAVPARQAGGQYKPPPANAARGGNAPGTGYQPNTHNETRPPVNNHASELQPHKYTPPNTGTPATDQRYQQQQDKLAAKQNQDHQRLQQQQEREHQQLERKSANDAQKQQLEQRHTQQTQQLEQKHSTQQQQVQQRQQPRQTESRPAENRPPEQKPH